jgi:hypothetical protein
MDDKATFVVNIKTPKPIVGVGVGYVACLMTLSVQGINIA